jgi:GNAT superfamily N-acetyltransferase
MTEHHEILARLDYERRELERDGEVIERLASLTRLRSADHARHQVIYSALSADTADAAIAREIAYHRQLNVSFEWKAFAHDNPPDLLARLAGHGFEIGAMEAVLVHDLANPPTWVRQADGPKVVRVDDLEQVALFCQLAAQIFEKDYALTGRELTAALAAGSTQHRGYIIYDRDEPVSVGRLYTHPQSAFAGLYGGGTLKSHRGQGFYRALVAARARDALALGARYLQVDALPTSRPILERLGFERVTDTWPCDWRP